MTIFTEWVKHEADWKDADGAPTTVDIGDGGHGEEYKLY